MKKNLDHMNLHEFDTFIKKSPISLWDLDPEWSHELKGFEEQGNALCPRCNVNHYHVALARKVHLIDRIREMKSWLEAIK